MLNKLTQGDNQYFFKMFRFMRPYGFRYGFTQLIYSGQGFAMPFILSIFIGNIMAAIVGGNRDALITAGIQLAIMLAVFVTCLLVAVYANILILGRVALDFKRTLFRSFVKMGLEDASHSGEGIAAINTDADTALDIFEGPLMMFLMSVITIMGSTVVIFARDWRLGLGSLGVGFVSFYMQNRFTKPLAEVGRERLAANADSLKAASNVFSGAVAIRAYNMQPQTLIAFDRENGRLRTLDIRHGFITLGQNLFRTVEGWLTLLVVFGLGGWLAATGRIEFYTIAAVFVLCSALTSSIGQIGTNYASLQPPIAGAKRVFAIMEKADTYDIAKKDGTERMANGYTLAINNLNFCYLDGDSDVLSDINMRIEEGQMVALVGESGSGKSTLLRVLMGMYDRDSMDMSVGDLYWKEASLAGWRKNFAYVDQSCKLFDMTIRENIAMGLGGDATDEDVAEAARRASADSFICELDNGYDIPCGEKGDTLSGGQKQRIAIARALVKKAPVLLFDEATSALDADSEQHIMETMESLRKSHTIVFTTHNMANVQTADIIVVMENGRVAEIGTHEELVTKSGVYWGLVSTNYCPQNALAPQVAQTQIH